MMSAPDPAKKHRLKPYLWLVMVIGVLVPRRVRANWRQERSNCGLWIADLGNRYLLGYFNPETRTDEAGVSFNPQSKDGRRR